MIELIDLNKIYAMKNRTVHALRQITLRIGQGEFVSIVGRSGSGKTTLMNIMGCLDTPTSGKYLLDGKPVEWIGNRQMAQVRNRKIGFVFQDFHLISSLSAEENVELPLLFRGLDKKIRREEAMQALGKVGLEDRASHRPRQPVRRTKAAGGYRPGCSWGSGNYIGGRAYRKPGCALWHGDNGNAQRHS